MTTDDPGDLPDGVPEATDLSDPDVAGEVDPDQTFDPDAVPLPEED
jgi:hypothetical protein